jgi:NADPH2:quinone reductase
MRALVYDPGHAQKLVFADVPDPLPASAQALVQVHAVSLNFGEVLFLSELHHPGEVPGWDAAGVVLRAAAYLVGLLARRQIEASIGWRGSWERVDAAARALLDRRVSGKAVLDVRGGEGR